MPDRNSSDSRARHLAKRLSGGLIRLWAPAVVAVGLGLIGWAYSEHLQSVVVPVAAVTPTAAASATPNTTATPTASPTVAPLYAFQPALDSRIGTITLPALKLSWPIFEGTTNKQLDKGVGHYVTSVLPGMPDNSVLSGHRSTVFNRLGEMHIGDDIYVKTSAGTFTYRITKTRVVKRTDRTVIVPTSTATLTLTTCWPFNHAGLTTQAYIITAELQ